MGRKELGDLGATVEALLGQSVDEASSSLSKWLTDSGTSAEDPIFVGATEGVRSAYDNAEERMQALSDSLKKTFPQLEMKVLSGSEEANLELCAVRYAAEAVLGAKGCGLLSMGGASCQLTTPNSTDVTSLKAGFRQAASTTGEKKPVPFAAIMEGLSESAKTEELASSWRKAITDGLVPQCEQLSLSSNLSGTFVGISTTFFVAQRSGIASQRVAGDVAREAVGKEIEKALAASPTIEDMKKQNAKVQQELSSDITLEVLLDKLFDLSKTEFYFERFWEVPSGNPYVSNWGSGKALVLAGLV